jgi:hypothetical protein
VTGQLYSPVDGAPVPVDADRHEAVVRELTTARDQLRDAQAEVARLTALLESSPPHPQSADNPSAWCMPGQPPNLVPAKPRYPTIPKPNPDATPWGDGATQWSGADG